MNRHEIDALSLAFGLVFVVVVGWWLLARSVTVTAAGLGWLVALALIVLGGLGVAAALGAGRNRGSVTSKPDDEVSRS